jgi:hypothetical protein
MNIEASLALASQPGSRRRRAVTACPNLRNPTADGDISHHVTVTVGEDSEFKLVPSPTPVENRRGRRRLPRGPACTTTTSSPTPGVQRPLTEPA